MCCLSRLLLSCIVHVNSCPDLLGPALPFAVLSCAVLSGPVVSCPVRSYPVLSYAVLACHVKFMSCSVLPNRMFSGLILRCTALPSVQSSPVLVMSCPPCRTLSCPGLSYPDLCCLVLSCDVLSCVELTYPAHRFPGLRCYACLSGSIVFDPVLSTTSTSSSLLEAIACSRPASHETLFS